MRRRVSGIGAARSEALAGDLPDVDDEVGDDDEAEEVLPGRGLDEGAGGVLRGGARGKLLKSRSLRRPPYGGRAGRARQGARRQQAH
jgi:hypothetical protein